MRDWSGEYRYYHQEGLTNREPDSKPVHVDDGTDSYTVILVKKGKGYSVEYSHATMCLTEYKAHAVENRAGGLDVILDTIVKDSLYKPPKKGDLLFKLESKGPDVLLMTFPRPYNKKITLERAENPY